MGRLKMLPARLKPVAPKLGRIGDHASRDAVLPWRGWYKTKRWQRLRWDVLARDLFQCQRCKRTEGDTSQLVADHRIPHRGDPGLFWDKANLHCLCKGCHDSAKQSEERRGLI